MPEKKPEDTFLSTANSILYKTYRKQFDELLERQIASARINTTRIINTTTTNETVTFPVEQRREKSTAVKSARKRNPMEPSTAITNVIEGIEVASDRTRRGLRLIQSREQDFQNRLTMQLAGIALDPLSREIADKTLDEFWTRYARTPRPESVPELIIGGGLHAAVYSAARVLNGFPKPYVIEQSLRPGGVFAQTRNPVFHMNSRNRAGGPGIAGELGTSLNYLPGAPVQLSDITMSEYPTNADMGYVIRMALAQFANVIIGEKVTSILDRTGVSRTTFDVVFESGREIEAKRVIDARGLGRARGDFDPAKNILNFTQFMEKMDQPFPLRGIRRVAVIGDGDSSKCAIEALLGIGPQLSMSMMSLDHVDSIDWYGTELPVSCANWRSDMRGRYLPISGSLRPDRRGDVRVRILPRQAEPAQVPGFAVVEGRAYDLVVYCTGFFRPGISDLSDVFDPYYIRQTQVATKRNNRRVFKIGPSAAIPFDSLDVQNGITDQPGNAVSIFRLATRTAMLGSALVAP